MTHPQLICFTGPDGSGKSTLIKQLKDELPGAKMVTIWDLLMDPVKKEILPFKHPSDVDQYLSILHPEARLYFLFHCMMEALLLALEKDSSYLLIDSYWYKYYASELAYTARESSIAPLIKSFPAPDRIFYLQATVGTCAQRKQKYSGYESGFVQPASRDSFITFQEKVNIHLRKLMHEFPHTKLDGMLPPADILSTVKKELEL
jgi:thymidylate kinase